MFHASQESAQITRNQVTHLSEEVASLQVQLNAANAALKAVVAESSGIGIPTAPTLHRIPAPLGGSMGGGGVGRAFRSRLMHKTGRADTENQTNSGVSD